jgi:DNA-binding XRE family transcriptional regulator
MVKTSKKDKLLKAGWRIGNPTDFLQLSSEEAAIIEIKLALSRNLRERRSNAMTQRELAQRIQSSQPRIAKAEQGDQSVSVELLMRAMLATGATPKDIGKVIAQVA